MRYFLGMGVVCSKKGIIISQRKYNLGLLKEIGMSGCRPIDTPIEYNMNQKVVGKLIYLSHTQPNITFVVSLVSQFMHSPQEEHLEAVYMIIRYLKSTL